MSAQATRVPESAAPRAAWLHSWRMWSLKLRTEEPVLLTVADLAECECPHLCNRDHPNE